ncbi:MAG: hypothetical protein ACP5U2_15420 [Bryobacteraceae bacterium]
MGGLFFRSESLRRRGRIARLGFVLFLALAAILLASLIHGVRSLS